MDVVFRVLQFYFALSLSDVCLAWLQPGHSSGCCGTVLFDRFAFFMCCQKREKEEFMKKGRRQTDRDRERERERE